MVKKIISTTILCLAITASAFAATTAKVEKGDNYEFIYPVFKFLDKAAAEKANADVKTVIDEAHEWRNNPKTYLYSSSLFEVIRETKRYVNVTITSGNYTGGAHGRYYTMGNVYDKKTGEKLPYTHFVPEVTKEQLAKNIRDGKFKVFNSGLKKESNAPFLNDEYFYVSKDYILADDGYLYLMYQPYELDSYATGVTYVRIDKYGM